MTGRGTKKRKEINGGPKREKNSKTIYMGEKMIGNKLTIVHLNQILTAVR